MILVHDDIKKYWDWIFELQNLQKDVYTAEELI